jgi:hypothetical protein
VPDRGKRFNYTFYYPSPPRSSTFGVISGTRLTLSNARATVSSSFPVYKSITALDNEAMDILTLPAPAGTKAKAEEKVEGKEREAKAEGRGEAREVQEQWEGEAEPTPAARAHAAFARYLHRTKNTICGRHPIGVLLGALAAVERERDDDTEDVWMQFVRYEHSSECESVEDSSVSYASAYVVF